MRMTPVTVMVIFFENRNFSSESYLILAMFKVPFQQLRGTLTTAFQRYSTVAYFKDMDQRRAKTFIKT